MKVATLMGTVSALALLCTTATAAESLEKAIAKQAASRAQGVTQVGQVYKAVAEKRGDRTDWHVSLDPNNCYWFSGIGQEGVASLSLFLFEPDENFFSGRAATERSKTPEAVMMHCPKKSGMYRLQAKVTKGTGPYGVGVFAKPAPKKVEKKTVDLLGPAVEKMAKSVAPGAKKVGEFYASDAEISDWYTPFSKGDCYWVVGVGEDSIDELFLYLWDPDDDRVTQSRAKDHKASIGHCAKRDGMYHIQTKINDGDGHYKVGVYVKKKS